MSDHKVVAKPCENCWRLLFGACKDGFTTWRPCACGADAGVECTLFEEIESRAARRRVGEQTQRIVAASRSRKEADAKAHRERGLLQRVLNHLLDCIADP